MAAQEVQERLAVASSGSSRPCPQDCSRCTMPQQLFCTTRMLFDLSRSQQDVREQIAVLSKALGDIRSRLDVQGDAQLSIPFIEAT